MPDQKGLATLQAVTIVITAGAIGPSFGLGWSTAAAAGALLALAEWRDRTHADAVVTGALLSACGVAVVLTVAEPWSMLTAFAVAWVWAALRHTLPLQVVLPRRVLSVAVAVLSLGLLSALGRVMASDTALVVAAVAVVVVAGVVRVTRARAEMLWAVWIPVSAAVLVTATAGRPGLLAVAAGLDAIAFAAAPRWPAVRVWSTTAAAVIAVAFGAAALELVPEGAAVAVALIGLGLVVVAARWNRPLYGHLGAAGHVATAIAVAVVPAFASDTGGNVCLVVVVSAFALGWALTTLAQETTGSSVADLLGRAVGSEGWLAGAAAAVPAVLATMSVPFVVPAVLVAAGALGDDSPWLAVAASSVLVGGALLARLASGRRRLSHVIGDLGVWLIVIAILGTIGSQAAAATQTLLVAGFVVVLGPVVRREYMVWLAWLSSAAATLLLADLAGVPSDSLHLVLLVWGALALVGALAVDDVVAGRRAVGEGIRRTNLLPPVVLGAIAVPLGLAPAYAESAAVYGWWSLAVAVVVGIVAWEVRVAALSARSAGLSRRSPMWPLLPGPRWSCRGPSCPSWLVCSHSPTSQVGSGRHRRTPERFPDGRSAGICRPSLPPTAWAFSL